MLSKSSSNLASSLLSLFPPRPAPPVAADAPRLTKSHMVLLAFPSSSDLEAAASAIPALALRAFFNASLVRLGLFLRLFAPEAVEEAASRRASSWMS